MSRSLTITYVLHPPTNSSIPPSLDPNVTHAFPISVSDPQGSDTTGYKAHYDALKVAIAEAKAKTGDELTEWRDAVGTAEQTKESKSGGKKGDIEDDNAEEEDEEEAT